MKQLEKTVDKNKKERRRENWKKKKTYWEQKK